MIPPNYNLTPAAQLEPSKNSFESLYQGVSEQEKQEYCRRALDNGYQIYSTEIIDGNEFTVLTKEEQILTVMWIPVFEELRVIAETTAETALPPQQWENKWKPAGCDTYLSQVGLQYRQGCLEGILDIIRLDDGSFVLLDGGHDLPENADRIYNILRKDAPDPDHIVIAAWFFSHGHMDHIGFFPYFAERYHDKVTVERFIYNFPTESVCDRYRDGIPWTVNVENALAKCFADSQKIRAHAGQVFYLRNAKLTLLYTHDLYMPKNIDWYNSTSLVITLELDGKKAFLPTDAGEAIADLISWMYSRKTFSADILQIGHHGIINTPYILYPLVDATYVLWPMGTGNLSCRKDADGNYTSPDCSIYVGQPFNYFVTHSKKSRSNIFMANDDIHILTIRDGKISVTFYNNDEEYLNQKNKN